MSEVSDSYRWPSISPSAAMLFLLLTAACYSRWSDVALPPPPADYDKRVDTRFTLSDSTRITAIAYYSISDTIHAYQLSGFRLDTVVVPVADIRRVQTRRSTVSPAVQLVVGSALLIGALIVEIKCGDFVDKC